MTACSHGHHFTEPWNTMSLRKWRYLQLIRNDPWLRGAPNPQSPRLYLGSVLPLYRFFSSCQACKTDGVYSALTEMRVKIPWIEALNRKRGQTSHKAEKSSISAEANPRDLTAKRMSESYHKVVCTSHSPDRRLGY